MGNKANIFSSKYLVLVLFFFASFLIYSSSLGSSFHFDDYHNIVDNPDVAITGISYDTLKQTALTNKSGLRSLSYLSFALNHYFSGADTTSYHIVNLIIHMINAFLIYLVILKMFSYESSDDESKERLALTAFFTALVWLVTPVNSQAVIFIVQRMTLLMTLFFLLAFLCYMTGRKAKRPLYFLLTFIFFALSILSKENGVTLIPVIIAYEFVIVKKGEVKRVTKQEIILLALLFAAFLLPLFLYSDSISLQFASGGEAYDFTMSERYLTQFRVVIFYLSLILLPLPGRLSVMHDIVKSTSLFTPVTTIVSIILVIAIAAFSIVRIKKSPYLSFALLWFFVTLSVVLIMPIEIFPYEHRIYLPSIFVFGVIIKYAADKFYERSAKYLIIALSIIVLLFSVMTAVRSKAWENGITLWSDVISKYPNCARAYNNLGNTYFELGKMEPAEQNLLKAVSHKKGFSRAYRNLGKIYYKRGDYKRALEVNKEAVKYKPEYAPALFNLGISYAALKDYDNAIKYLNEALARNPDIVGAYNEIGKIYYEKGNLKRAKYYFMRALKLKPNDRIINNNLKELEKLIK